MKKIILSMLITLGAMQCVSAIPTVGGIDIDFREAAWGPSGPHAITVGNVTATAENNEYLFWAADDGLGILGNNQEDEIDTEEWLDITFATDTCVTSTWVTDLFDAPDGNGQHENGTVSLYLNNALLASFDFDGSTSEQGNGSQEVLFGSAYTVDHMMFTVENRTNNEYSVAGIETEACNVVPAPGALLLGTFGMGGVSYLRRRRVL